MRERWGGETGSIGRGSLVCTTSAAYILGSGTLNRTYSPLQPCISLWTGSSASRKRRCVAEEKSARSARGGSRTAAAGMRRGAAMRSQHQGLLRDRGRARATRDPVKRQAVTPAPRPRAWSGPRAAAHFPTSALTALEGSGVSGTCSTSARGETESPACCARLPS